jgi:hypothetical protein
MARPRDPIWDEMEVLFGHVVSGTNAHHKRNKAVKDLKLLGASAADLPRLYRLFQARFSGCTCTDVALATHYPLLIQCVNASSADSESRARGLRAGQLGTSG